MAFATGALSRRDRKARHLVVAAHLRTAFPGDGEEVTDVIARHYLDALNAIPDDPDAAEIRGQAVTVMTRAAERAERTGAPAQAAARYAAAAELSPPDAADGTAARLWERAAQAACADADFSAAVGYAEQARGGYLRHGHDRFAARAQAIAGRALRSWGRHTEAREQLTAAVEVLRADPDPDTVQALQELATLEVFAGTPDADRLGTEALTLGQALGLGSIQLSELFLIRGLYHASAERRPQAISYLRESARLGTEAGDAYVAGRAMGNLSDVLAGMDPAAAVDAGRAAIEHLRRTGARRPLAAAIMNVADGWPLATATVAPWPRSPPRSRACARSPRPTISPMACSTTSSTSWPSVAPRPPRVPWPRPATSPAACAASPCWIGPSPWARRIPPLRPHRTHRASPVDPCDPASRASTVRPCTVWIRRRSR